MADLADSLHEMDPLVADARRQLAELLLRRITVRVRDRYPTAAALRVEDGVEPTGSPVLLAVLDSAGKPLPDGSCCEADADAAAWSESAVEDLSDDLSEDLAWYLPLARPTTPSRIPLAVAR
jgi:hypothetical protein